MYTCIENRNMINTSLHEYQICDPSESGKPDIRPPLSQYRCDEKQDDVYKKLYIPSSVFQQISFRILTLPMTTPDTRTALVMFIPGLPHVHRYLQAHPRCHVRPFVQHSCRRYASHRPRRAQTPLSSIYIWSSHPSRHACQNVICLASSNLHLSTCVLWLWRSSKCSFPHHLEHV